MIGFPWLQSKPEAPCSTRLLEEKPLRAARTAPAAKRAHVSQLARADERDAALAVLGDDFFGARLHLPGHSKRFALACGSGIASTQEGQGCAPTEPCVENHLPRNNSSVAFGSVSAPFARHRQAGETTGSAAARRCRLADASFASREHVFDGIRQLLLPKWLGKASQVGRSARRQLSESRRQDDG